ncbi:MAG: hypothetical protein WCF12_02445 [Propionicimonas sp.]
MLKAARAIIAMVVGLLVLSGCAAANPTTAASVNGVVITDAHVEAIAQALAEFNQEANGAGGYRLSSAGVLISNELGRQVAAQKGVVIADADRQAVIASQQELAAMAQIPALTQLIHDYAAYYLTRTKVGETDYFAAVAGFDVVVNPRFGTWNQTLGTLTGESGSLSSPAPAATTKA